MNETRREIEEMATILDDINIKSQCHHTCYDNCDNCEYYGKLDSMCFENFENAKALYNAGYGKVEDYKKEIKRLKGIIAMAERYYQPDLPFENEFDNAIKEAKQQAIKEFAKRLYDKYGKSCSEYYPEIIELTHKELEDLLKEYGIER